MRKLKAHLEDNFALYVVGTAVAVPVAAVVLYANFLVKLNANAVETNKELLAIMAEKSPEEFVAFSKALFNQS